LASSSKEQKDANKGVVLVQPLAILYCAHPHDVSLLAFSRETVSAAGSSNLTKGGS